MSNNLNIDEKVNENNEIIATEDPGMSSSLNLTSALSGFIGEFANGMGKVFVQPVVNVFYALIDSLNAPATMPMGSNIISLVCIVSDDLPTDVRNQYCKTVEVVNAMMIRSLIMAGIEGRFTANTSTFYRRLPFMTSFDAVEFDKAKKVFRTIGDTILSRKHNGRQVIDTFAEAFAENLDKHFKIYMEANNVILSESRTGAVPTYIEAETTILLADGTKAATKKFMIGVEVIPKVVPASEIAQMFIKQNKALAEEVSMKSRSIWEKIKAFFNFKTKELVKEELAEGNKDNAKVLNDLMNTVSGIKKPFVNILMSNNVADMLADAHFDVYDKRNVSMIYNRLPVMSVAVYDINTDTITASMNRSPIFIKRTAAEFNSETARMEKDLAELMRIKRIS